MNISYDSSLWAKGNDFYGVPQKTNWQFTHLGLTRCIPCIYRFQKGIVFDLLTYLDEDAMKVYYDTYKDIQQDLTKAQQCDAERNSPCKEVEIGELYINGTKMERFSSSSMVVTPFAHNGEEVLALQKHYQKELGNTTYFQWRRFKVPYPPTYSLREMVLRSYHINKINSLQIITRDTQYLYEVDESIGISLESPNKVLRFESPIDGITYTLYFQREEEVQIPYKDDMENLFSVRVLYEIQPDLPQNHKLIFDTNMDYQEKPENDFAPQGTSSIGIIGGSFGPTAIFYEGKEAADVPRGRHNLPLHSCFSKIKIGAKGEAQICLKGVQCTMKDSNSYTLGK